MRQNNRNRPSILNRRRVSRTLEISAGNFIFFCDFLKLHETVDFIVHIHDSGDSKSKSLFESFDVSLVEMVVGVYEAWEKRVAWF